jgi:para-aminobenzoate synthetase component 1
MTMMTSKVHTPYRHRAVFPLAEGQYNDIKYKMLNWAKQFSIFLFLDSNNYPSPHGKYECMLATGTAEILNDTSLEALQTFHDLHKDWLFGHIGYDYKNNLEARLSSRCAVQTGFPQLSFFRPQVVIYIDPGMSSLTIESIGAGTGEIWDAISNTPDTINNLLPRLQFAHNMSREHYLHSITTLQEHIVKGDCYEINFCTEGYVDAPHLDMLPVFKALNTLSPAPFAACYRQEDKYMACSSPERYLQKTGNTVLSQPIKGTARRVENAALDAALRTDLQLSEKERAENVMIVDLVRNDLARSCKTGSVKVDELFGIYSFPQVHQMISTISGEMADATRFTDAIKYSFPMGSMTGAPKIKVMELIDYYEQSRRELFSGTVGYVTPHGDFDFNVIIRSLFYNSSNHYLSYQAGGAITFDSDPEKEWDEMRLKAWALERIFAG